jgi:hypothetical protein
VIGLVLGFIALASGGLRSRAPVMLWSWLGAVLLYAFVVVTVERVDYYLYPLLPLAALMGGGAIAWIWGAVEHRSVVARGLGMRIAAGVVGAAVLVLAVRANRHAVAAYYRFRPAIFGEAKALAAALPPDALVVMGHYDPSILYYVDRKGWQEDPYLWTPFDEQSAIRKGARAFVAIEANRLARNVELAAWLQRFPTLGGRHLWPVYVTDPAHEVPGAEARWQAFRRREKAGLLPSAPQRVPTTNGQLIDPSNPQPALTAPPTAEERATAAQQPAR